MTRLAKEVRVDRDARGAPRIVIDGEELPWFTAGIVVQAPSLDVMPSVTITVPAERVVMVDEDPVTARRLADGAQDR